MVITRSQADAAEPREDAAELEVIERERRRRLSLDPPASPAVRREGRRDADIAFTPDFTRAGASHREATPALRREGRRDADITFAPDFTRAGPSRRAASPARSARSLRSTNSTAMRARMAELAAEEKLAELKRRELQIEADLVQKRLEADLAALEEEERSLHDEGELPEPNERIQQWVQQTAPVKKKKSAANIDALADAIEKLARPRISCPVLPTFSGAPNEWMIFRAAYNETTKTYKISGSENIMRIRSSITGEAKEIVSSLLYTASDPETIMKTLEQCFGRPEIIVDRALEELKKLQRPGPSATELNTFAVKLQNVVCVLNNVGNKGYLYNPTLARETLEKLSPHIRSRWCDYASENETAEPEIIMLSRFLMREADRALKYSYAPPSITKKEVQQKPAFTKRTNAVFNTTEESGKEKCSCCEKLHAAIDCTKFKAMNVNERWEHVKENKLCFKCLLKTHRRFNCKAKTCDKCSRHHHRLLHQDKKEETKQEEATEAVMTTSAAQYKKAVLLKMCPVTVIGPSGEATTLALFDEGATVTLIDEKLARTIGARGTSLPLKMRGVNTIQQEDYSQIVTVHLKSKFSDKLRPLRARTIKNMKLLQQSIPAKLLEQDHLKDLRQDEVCYEPSEPGILIGADHWEYIVSQELRVGRANQPGASRTQLGWVIHGTMPRAIVADQDSVLHVHTAEAIMKQNKELHELIEKHFSIEAVGINPEPRLSERNLRATKIIEETIVKTKQQGYEVSLPWQSEDQEEEVLHTRDEEDCADGWLPDPSRFSKFETLVKTTARVLFFIERCRRRATNIEKKHIEEAERALIRRAQKESFPDELQRIKTSRPITKSSRLFRLDPIIEDGILRVRGRIGAADAPIEMKKPVILDGRHHITKLIVMREHCMAGHANRERVTNDLRQKYWVIHLRPTVRRIEKDCRLCQLRKKKPEPPATGDLPRARLEPFQRPFSYCGTDYFGPMMVKIGRRREKRWGALFTCLTTRAVHIEVVPTLSISSAIMALRRMAARRGWPRLMMSDNGTNFRGADKELRAAYEEWIPALREESLLHRMEWRFTPPGAPNQGGAWERLVRSIKVALNATLNEREPPEEVLNTLLTEAEYSVNARPLTHVSVDPEEPEALTPNHFLLGSSNGLPTTGPCSEADRRTWRASQALADHFWRRWLREYLPTLVPRGEPATQRPQLQEGDVVIIVDHTLPRNVWPRGIVERTYKGPDGGVRVADVRTKTGVFKRPTSKIVVLVKKEAARASPGGECCGHDERSVHTL